MSRIIVDANQIQKAYGGKIVLDCLDLRVEEGSIAALLGPNGAGKTTLVRILSTLTRPDAGAATIAGHDVVREPRAVRAVISLTGQYAALDELLTGEENLRLAARLWKLDPREGRARIHELLSRFQLTDAARRPVKTWSGGMKRKLDLAMSLIGRPRVLFLDEPTTGLDPRSRNALWDIVRDLKRSGVTVLLTTQYLDEADQLADRITLIDHGRVIAEGAAETLKRQIGRDVVVLTFPDHRTATHALLTLRGQPATLGTTGDAVHIATDGSAAHVHGLLETLQAASIAAETITFLTPTLDDVFLSLTARPETRSEVYA
ncbi:MAG TPA: ATP-binding cassette domain-containing protein [Thermomicrobiales bacterium]|nr:ATP-binding cassette domain-containing protein [Thermomicrobiales bacterium]